MAKFTMRQLSDKYKGFTAPAAQVTIGGRTAAALGWRVSAVESDTGVRDEAGMCVVTLAEVYDVEKSKFLCEDSLTRGTPVQVALGYIVTEPVFSGFLYEVEYRLGGEEEPTATLVCMDVKAAMMGGGILDFSGSMTYKQVVEGFFKGKNARGYSVLSKAPPMSAAALEQPVGYLPGQMDDYAFLCFIARRFGLECFVGEDGLLLREKPASPPALLSITPAEGIARLTARLRSAGYVKTVSVLGGSDDERDGEKKHALGSADNPFQLAGASSDAGRLLGARRLELYAANVRDDKAAETLARGQLRQRQTLSSTLELELRGLPELKPGFSIEVAKVSPRLNGSWYIAAVSHRMSEDSFRTTVEARRDI